MAPTIFVCHDTGNTNVLLNTARSMLEKNPDADIKFFVIGEAANKIFSNAANSHFADKVIRLTDYVNEKDFSKINLRPLNEDELASVLSNLQQLKPGAVITGCSCGPQALAPFQIAELLTKLPEVEVNIIYNGDFFQDMVNNPFWTSLTQDWIEKVALYLALADAVDQALAVNRAVKCVLAGSTALDNVMEATPAEGLVENVRNALGIQERQELVFISGSKFIKDDLKLLEALSDCLKKYPDTAVRMGMHPGTSDVADYVDQMARWLDERKIANLRLVVRPDVAAKIPEDLKRNAIVASLSGDDIFWAASSVASALPSTLPSQAIMRQKPAFCLEEYKLSSYLHGSYASNPELLFAARPAQGKLDRTKIGLPERKTVEIISEGLTAGRRR